MNKHFGGFAYARYFVCCLAAVMILAVSSNASPDGNKKNKTKDAPAPSQPVAMPAGPDNAQIDNNIGEMLAAFQLGKVDMMHKYYSDGATFVSGEYEPPIVGWQNYAPMYQREWSAFQGMQLNRRDTIIFTHGDVAWATYQWQFDSSYNGQPFSVRGQTTLVFNKVGDNWLIVHNHTSEIIPTDAPAQPTVGQQQPLQETPAAPASARP
jgi:ketosteroid isomerase-like protein